MKRLLAVTLASALGCSAPLSYDGPKSVGRVLEQDYEGEVTIRAMPELRSMGLDGGYWTVYVDLKDMSGRHRIQYKGTFDADTGRRLYELFKQKRTLLFKGRLCDGKLDLDGIVVNGELLRTEELNTDF